ncbi:hypothetical protein D9M68_607770 [compost metagenome]
MGRGHAPQGRRRAGLCARARAGASAPGRAALRAWPHPELLGRLQQRHHAPARRHALPRPAARGAARQWHAGLRSGEPSARRRQPRRARAACGGAHRTGGAQVRAAAGHEPDLPRAPARLWRAAPGRADPGGAAAGARGAGQLPHRRHDVVLARRREPRLAPPCARRRGAAARALRPGGVGPPPLRAAVGLDVQVRGLHAGAEAAVRLLRAADAVARPRDRLGQRERA